MTDQFKCPKCYGELSVGGYVILSAKNDQGNGGLILLSPEMGNYQVDTHPNFPLKEHESLDVHCPICAEDLVYTKDVSLAHLIKVDNEDFESTILFSRTKGEMSTMEIKGEAVLTYGEHAKRFMDPDWFLK